uniref:Transcription initiation factor TFIID subunit 1 n=1 Tax=Rhabditophanes sp. KR3021 TaxID=114890 RepID=A0AC35TJR2_9BILA
MNDSLDESMEMFDGRDSEGISDSCREPSNDPSETDYFSENPFHKDWAKTPEWHPTETDESNEGFPGQFFVPRPLDYLSHVLENTKWGEFEEGFEWSDLFEGIEWSDIDEGVVGEMISADVVKDDAENKEFVNNVDEMELNKTLVEENESLTDASAIVVTKPRRKFVNEKAQLADTNKWSEYYMAAPETIELKGPYGLRKRRNPLLLRTFVKEKAQLADTNKWSQYYMAAPENIEFKGLYGLRRRHKPNQ